MRTLAQVLSLSLLATAVCQAADPAPIAPASNPGAVSPVGVSSRDGITLSGVDVLVTRNGVTERLTKEMSLSSGVTVKPDGTVVGTDGSKIMLRPSQVITFDGKIMNAPVVESVPAGATSIPGRSGPAGTPALPEAPSVPAATGAPAGTAPATK